VLDLRFVRENIDLLKEKLALRGEDLDLNPFIKLDEERRALIQEVEALRNQRNQVSDEISRIKQQGGEVSLRVLGEMRDVSQSIKLRETDLPQYSPRLCPRGEE
jgi:seryl-tRNA synthetase